MKDIKIMSIGLIFQRIRSYLSWLTKTIKTGLTGYNISRCQKISEESFERHKDKVNWEPSLYTKICQKILRKNMKNSKKVK